MKSAVATEPTSLGGPMADHIPLFGEKAVLISLFILLFCLLLTKKWTLKTVLLRLPLKPLLNLVPRSSPGRCVFHEATLIVHIPYTMWVLVPENLEPHETHQARQQRKCEVSWNRLFRLTSSPYEGSRHVSRTALMTKLIIWPFSRPWQTKGGKQLNSEESTVWSSNMTTEDAPVKFLTRQSGFNGI